MQFNISVLSTEITNKGKYNQLEVSYKNLDSGKVESKKIMSFVKPDTAYKGLVDSKTGDKFQVTAEKNNDSGYWDWTNVTQFAPGQEVNTQKTTAGTPAPKSNYETAEERAKRQVYIVKQSSLSAAIALLSVGAKTPPSTELVLQEAQKFVNWVFGNDVKSNVVSLADLPDDIPVD